MNSEELELSLRTEFESYLKGVLADMRQEATEFQTRIEAEFDKHKAQFDEAFRSYAERFDSTHEFDEAFSSSVAEHLRLARDEGARITATAMAEAEKLEEEIAAAAPPPPPPPPARYNVLRDAINDISGKSSQSAILKSLIEHAGEFAPRGAFFIVKSGHFVGWKVFGESADNADDAIREVHFPTSSDSILSTAMQSLTTVEGSAGQYSGDDAIMGPLNYGQPDRMYAIPLVARGRSVAVLYSDHGSEDGDVNTEALETLVRVAGLTVELLASSSQATQADTVVSADFENAQHDAFEETTQAEEPSVAEDVYDEPSATPFDAPVENGFETPASGFAFSETPTFENGFEQQAETVQDAEPVQDFAFTENTAPEYQAADETFDQQLDSQPFEAEAPIETVVVEEETVTAFEPAPDSAEPVYSGYDEPVEQYQPVGVQASGGFSQVAEVEAPTVSVPKARLSDRPVDLPIEVPEDERRIHNDARRFARLLVSEIKLYNEKKVAEGRENQDLYERLREAIDRSREMYDKRVQPPVAAKFDYFHYEIVNSLADGEMSLLGANYPGSTI